MVVEYLEKIRDNFIQEEVQVRSLLNNVLNEKKENIEIIKVLEVNNDPNFESFTPRQVNSFNKSKIVELQKNQKELDIKISKYEEMLVSISKNIDEVTEVIKEARLLEK